MIFPIRDGPKAPISRELQAKIGQQLRAMYAELMEQEHPEHLRELVRRLELPQQPR